MSIVTRETKPKLLGSGLLFLGLILTLLQVEAADASLFNEVAAGLKTRLNTISHQTTFTAANSRFLVTTGLTQFYQKRAFQPAWTDDYGLLPYTDQLIDAIQNADREGLRPLDYGWPTIRRMLLEIEKHQKKGDLIQTELLVDLELILTNAFLTYASHLVYGRLDPVDFHPEWTDVARNRDFARELQDALDRDRLQAVLEELPLDRMEYRMLRQLLAVYRRIQDDGGWPVVREGPPLKMGERGPRVLDLRSRLKATGDLIDDVEGSADKNLFDVALKHSVKHFQAHHHLEVDGIAGPSTLQALRVPVEDRIRQIEVNLERWRWLPRNPGERHILVDIAAFRLDVVEFGKVVDSMRVIVGGPDFKTPVLNDVVTDVVINPYWYIPTAIVQNEILPKVRENPHYLKNMGMKVFQVLDGESWEINPETIDWNVHTNTSSELRFRQDPGPDNFLGRFKIILANPLDIYLHDTLSPDQFNASIRDFSHGCIRLQKPEELVEFLIKPIPDWDRNRIKSTVNSGSAIKIRLPKPLPVYLFYWTVRMDRNGLPIFQNDIYQLDNPINDRF